MDNMTVIQFPESPRLKRGRYLLELAESKMAIIDKLHEEMEVVMLEFTALQVSMAPLEMSKLLDQPYQMEIDFVY
jgi:trehalose-6-phosphate synthase